MPFKRPEHIEFPHTYYTFKVKSRDSGEIIEFRVQDLPDDKFEEALEMLKTHFLPDESFCSAKGVDKDPNSTKIICDIWKKLMKAHLSIACFRNDGSDNLIAVNCLTVLSKDDPEENEDYQDEKIKEVFDALKYTSNLADIYGKYKIDRYLGAYGLCVNRAYRGMGIATEMLKARVPYMKEMSLKITGTAFTAIGSQVAARKAGFEDYFGISYEDLKENNPRFDFVNNSTKTKELKLMALKVDE